MEKTVAVGQESRDLLAALRCRAFKKLAILNAAVLLDNLRVAPKNHRRCCAGIVRGEQAIGADTAVRLGKLVAQ